MQYRKDRYGKELSVLGFGCMRFTKNGKTLDLDKAEKEILAAFNAGVNYFDTAYIYTGSEALLGEVLGRNGIRGKVNIATKIPHYLVNSVSGAEKIFGEELSRLQTDHIDYYLLHMLTDEANLKRMKNLGIMDWLEEKKKSGAVRNIGFSYHGNTENFLKILEGYDWDFCQIQYNYIDENTQAGAAGLKAAAAKGIPVIIMEPLRGGKLVNLLPKDAVGAMKENKRGWSPAAWALRWLYNQPEVTVVLSGMNSLEMVNENIETAGSAEVGEFNEEDFAFLETIKEYIRAGEKVGCTGCGYCMPCPKGVDIPAYFRFYNAMYTEGKKDARSSFIQSVGLSKQPPFATQCVGCGKCEKHCPQGLPIREKLKEADRALRPFPWKIGVGVVRALILRKSSKKC
ncbi:MAG: aldo/keto reductase [Clostridiales bacterium]|nr:aldo/keto reductase [Clostridiales bacterium]